MLTLRARRSKAQLEGMKKLIAAAEEKMQDLMSAAKVPLGRGRTTG